VDLANVLTEDNTYAWGTRTDCVLVKVV